MIKFGGCGIALTAETYELPAVSDRCYSLKGIDLSSIATIAITIGTGSTVYWSMTGLLTHHIPCLKFPINTSVKFVVGTGAFVLVQSVDLE